MSIAEFYRRNPLDLFMPKSPESFYDFPHSQPDESVTLEVSFGFYVRHIPVNGYRRRRSCLGHHLVVKDITHVNKIYVGKERAIRHHFAIPGALNTRSGWRLVISPGPITR